MVSPQHFCFNKSQVKAFVLGADPTNFSKDKKRVELHFAFGIGQNPNYFRVILQNLKDIGLHLEDLYIQNLLPEYQEAETGENKYFNTKASANTTTIASEFDNIDHSKKVPVFITAEAVYKVVLKDEAKPNRAIELYNLKTESGFNFVITKCDGETINVIKLFKQLQSWLHDAKEKKWKYDTCEIECNMYAKSITFEFGKSKK